MYFEDLKSGRKLDSADENHKVKSEYPNESLLIQNDA